jgi:hypothetical protein
MCHVASMRLVESFVGTAELCNTKVFSMRFLLRDSCYRTNVAVYSRGNEGRPDS